MMKQIQSVLAMLFIGLLLNSTAYAADPGNGGQVYSRHCTTCHGDGGRGTMPGVPDFTRGQGLFKSNSDLISIIEQGKQIMPAYQGILSRDEMDDVIAYIRSMY